MKGTFLALFCITSLTAGAFTGELHSKGPGKGKGPSLITIGVSVGAGIPLGDFSKSDLILGSESHISGWAKTGFHFNVNAGYKLGEHAGLMVQIGGNMNKLNAIAYDATYHNTGNTTKSTTHYIGSYLAGPFLTYPVGNKMSVNVHVLGGLMTANYAELIQTTSTYSADITYTPSKGFGYEGGAGLGYQVSKLMDIAFGLDYLGGTATFSGYSTTYTPAGGPPQATPCNNVNQYMNVGILQVSVGVVMHL